MPKELWKPIIDYEGSYEVSNLGQVRNSKTNQVLRPGSARGYLTVHLRKNNASKAFYIHQLVLRHFIGMRPDSFAASHLDANKNNNCVTNLCWESYGKNNLRRNYHGEAHVFAKLTAAQVLEIRELYKTKKFTQAQLGQQFGVGRTTVGDIVRNNKWSHL